MLRSANEIIGYTLSALDGELGRVNDFLFDDQSWQIRYLLAKTVPLVGRKVLISPTALERPDWSTMTFPVKLDKSQVKASPGVDLQQPLSQQSAQEVNRYYGWPGFEQNRHLRSFREIRGYDVVARDGKSGHVDDFILDDDEWSFRYLVVDTRAVLPGKHVLLAARWIDDISWTEGDVHVDTLRETVKNGPPFDPNAPVNREIESRLYDYFGRPHDRPEVS